MPEPTRILVIRLSALGNVVQSLGPFAAIRRHHAGAHITLLTTAPYADWLSSSPYFDAVWVDDRPEWWNLRALRRLRRRLVEGRFERVYDLQTSGRSSRYFRLFPRHAPPEWSGIAAGCSHPDRRPDRNSLHDLERQAGQLRAAGIDEVPVPDLSWATGDITRFALSAPFALLVPGSSPHRPAKRWPPSRYALLAEAFVKQGLAPVVVGSTQESNLARTIGEHVPIVDLTGRTTFGDLASLARAATLAAGNDTGPMHLIAAAGCPSVVLFSAASDPLLCAPRGPCVANLRRPSLDDLDAATVIEASVAVRRDGQEACHRALSATQPALGLLNSV